MKTHIFPLKKVYWLFLLVILAGCNWYVSSPVAPLSTSTLSSIFTDTLLPTSANKQTITAVPTATEKPTSMPTYTPLPTFSSDEQKRRIFELLASNAGCRLPCWWGITPGESSSAEAWNFFLQFDPIFATDEIRSLSFLIPVSKDISLAYGINVYLRIADNVVRVISISQIDQAVNYSLPHLLTDYGQPSEVWIHTYRSYLGGIPPADVLLFYPEQGILVRYPNELSEIDEKLDRANICFDSRLELDLWSPDEQINFDQAQDLAQLDYKKYDKPLLPLDKATGISIEQFYNYRTKERVCLTTKLSLWPEP